MFVVETFLSMLFVKCKTRGEQIIVVIGMLILIAACFGVGKFFLGMSNATLESVTELSEMESASNRLERDTASVSLYGYATVAICSLLGIIFAIMAVINLVRLITGTGLADPDEGWS
jgi:hypothetical protein